MAEFKVQTRQDAGAYFTSYNHTASVDPAKATEVKNFLIRNGVQPDQISLGDDGVLYMTDNAKAVIEAKMTDPAFKKEMDGFVSGAAAVAAVTATPDEKRFGELMTEFAKNGALSDEKALEAKKLVQKIGVDKATEIAKASGAEGALNEEQKKEAQKDLTDFERDLPEEKKNAKKSKRDIVSEMIGEGNIMGAIMAMLFMVDDPEKTVSEKIAQTKEAITSGKPVEPEKAVEAGTPAAAKTGEAGKEAEGAKKDEVKLSPEKENDKNIYIAKLEAEQKLADAEAKLAKLKAGFTEKTPEEVDKLTLDEKKAYNAAKNEVQKAQGEVEMLKDDAATYKTSHDKAAEAENAKLKEEKAELEAQIKALEEKASGLDKVVVADKEATQKTFDKLIEQRKRADGPEKLEIENKLRGLLESMPEGEFKKGLKATVKEQTEQFKELKGLLNERYVEGEKSGEAALFEQNIQKLDLVNGDKAMKDQDKKVETDKAAADKVAADAKKAVRVASVKEAVMGLDRGIGADDTALTGAVPGANKDGKINKFEVESGDFCNSPADLSKIKAAVAALDGDAKTVSQRDVEQFAAILNEMNQKGIVTGGAKTVLTTSVPKSTDTGMAPR